MRLERFQAAVFYRYPWNRGTAAAPSY